MNDSDAWVRACVIYDTRYGNTQKLANALAVGLVLKEIQVECLGATEVAVDSPA